MRVYHSRFSLLDILCIFVNGLSGSVEYVNSCFEIEWIFCFFETSYVIKEK